MNLDNSLMPYAKINSKEVKAFLMKYYDQFLQVLKEKAQSEEAASYLIKEVLSLWAKSICI